jgi:hypothetical protein
MNNNELPTGIANLVELVIEEHLVLHGWDSIDGVRPICRRYIEEALPPGPPTQFAEDWLVTVVLDVIDHLRAWQWAALLKQPDEPILVQEIGVLQARRDLLTGSGFSSTPSGHK